MSYRRIVACTVARPTSKRLVYNLCLKSRIRYSAGHTPLITRQYKKLDRVPPALLRQIYELRRTFPAHLIYAPKDIDGCGESQLSNTPQLQKLQYLHSISHLSKETANGASSLIERMIFATTMNPSFYCTSLIEWGTSVGLKLWESETYALPVEMKVLQLAKIAGPRKISRMDLAP